MESQVKRSPSRTLAWYALLLAAAMLLSYIEALLPSLGVFKLGLANIAVTLAVYLVSRRCGAVIMLCRTALTSLLFGSVTTFFFSLLGGIFAFAVSASMKALYTGGRITLVGISVLCAAAHNLGQVAAACILFASPSPLAMLWWLLLAAIPSGVLTGAAAQIAVRRIGDKV